MDYEKRPSGLWMPKEKVKQRLGVGGYYRCWIDRDGETIDAWEQHNVVVYQGLDSLLAVYFTGASQITNWYMGIYQGNYAPQAGDTANTIVGNSTECTSYTNGTRMAYQPTEGNQQASNASSPAQFVFSSSATIYGAFLISSSGKGSTSGTLFSATSFSSPKTLAQNDQLNLTYVVAAASS